MTFCRNALNVSGAGIFGFSHAHGPLIITGVLIRP